VPRSPSTRPARRSPPAAEEALDEREDASREREDVEEADDRGSADALRDRELVRTMLTAAATATIIAAASAVATFGTFFAYLWFGRRGEANAAREEALALAATRAEVISELEAQLERLRRQNQIQRFYTVAFVDLLREIRIDLEAVPPEVDTALARIREVVADGRPAA
jgi:hypothetical protein